MNENLQKTLLYIPSGILLFIFSGKIAAFVLKFIFGSNWMGVIGFGLLVMPSLAFLGLWIVYSGLSCLREYMKNRNVKS